MNIKTLLAKYSRDVGVLETLSQDNHWEVRRGVAGNRNAPPHILETLSRDWTVEVRVWARETLRNKDKV